MSFDRTLNLINNEIKKLEQKISILEPQCKVYDRYENTFRNIHNPVHVLETNLKDLFIMNLIICDEANEADILKLYDDLELEKFSREDLQFFYETFDEVEISPSSLLKNKALKKMGFNVKASIDAYKKYGEYFVEALNYYISLMNFSYMYEDTSKIADEISFLRTKDKKRLTNYRMSDILETFVDSLQKLVNTYYDKQKNALSELKSSRRKLKNLTEAVALLNNNFEISKFNFDRINKLISDEEVLHVFIEEFKIELLLKNQQLRKEYKQLSNENNPELIFFFSENGFNYADLSDEAKKVICSNEYYLKIFEFLKKHNLKDNEILEYILLKSNEQKVYFVSQMFKTELFTPEFFREHLELCGSAFDNALDVIKVFEDFNVSKKLISLDSNLLLEDSKIIKNNLTILKGYKLLEAMKLSEDISYLYSTDLNTRIDLYVELGLSNMLDEHIDLLNYPVSLIKRLFFMKNVDAEVKDYEDIISVLTVKDFVVLDKDIDKYVYDTSSLYIPSELMSLLKTKTLEFDDIEDRTISFDNIYISNVRVFNNLLKLNNVELDDSTKMLYATLYGSLYNFDDVEVIINKYNQDNQVRG